MSGLGVHIEPKVRTASSEQVIRELASRAHGVVTRAELIDAGFTPAEIKRRMRNGLLLPVIEGSTALATTPRASRRDTSQE